MSKELYVTSTPHETKLAVVEDDQLVEVFFERENEYTLAGSIYKGKVTRVLPGMQSAFVEIGLERDAFLYVTDFLEEVEEDDAEPIKQTTEGGDRSERPERSDRSDRSSGDRGERPERSERSERGGRGDRGRDRGGRHRRSGRPQADPLAAAPAEGSFTIEHDSTEGASTQGFEADFDQAPLDQDFDAQPLGAIAPTTDSAEGQESDSDAQSRGPRRWRGRRGRRRGRGGVPESKFAHSESSESAPSEASERIAELTPTHDLSAEDDEDDHDSQSAVLGEQGESAPQLDAAEAPQREERHKRPRGDREDRPREGRDRQSRGREGRPQEDRPREDRPREGRDREDRPREGRQQEDRPREGRGREDRPREDRPREGRPQEDRPRPQPIVLPGESLAKFGRKNAADQEKLSGQAGQSEARTQLPRPSTEYTAPTGLTGAGLLAGESLAKYRNRPPQPPIEPKKESRSQEAREETQAPRKSERPRWEEQQDSRREQKSHEGAPSESRPDERREVARHEASVAPVQPSQEFVEEDETIDVSEEPTSTPVPVQTAAPEPLVEEAADAPIEESVEIPAVQQEVQQDAQQDFQPGANRQPGRGDHRFGQGVVEEETIEEEEHELAPFSEQLEEGEFEELEEETLEHREEDVIAAGDGLAEAVALSRVEGGTETYMVDEDDDDEEDEDEEGDEADAEGDDEEDEEGDEDELQVGDEADLAEAEAYDETGEAVDPEDPNYAGRAEHRTAAGTAGFQQRTERGGAPGRPRRDRGGDRGRRGGRPPMRRGGPRRNTPRGPMPQIGELLKEGQEILVQIAKEPMAKKGARITSHIALPGRFLVFMPTVNHTGVSRKIGSDEERQRLKRILLSEKGQSNGGFIVRTAASGASEEDLRADIRFLINLWGEIKQRAETSKGPTLIYHDLNLVERILRDQVTANFSHIWVDTEAEYERILRFASRFQPSLVKRVKLYTKDTPLFEQFNIQDEINKALKSKVWLKSGGYIVINQTEALVAIDINTGKYVGKTGRLEDTIVKTNLDAIKEIVRQIRLRDLGGIIILDFIDMDERKNRQKVMQALEAELKNDRSPSKVLQFNDFGLVAITRKRVKQSLERTLSTQCTYCTGTGMIKSVATACNEIYVEMRKMNKHLEGSQIMLRVHPEVAKALKENQGRWLVEMEELTGKSIIVKSDPSQHQEQFEIH